MVRVAPSVLTADFLELKNTLVQLKDAGVDFLHLDVMDGIFVPNISFGIPVIESIRKHTDIPFDVHLMIDRPDRYIREFAKVSDYLGFHYEAGSDVAQTLSLIRDCGCKACLTIKPATDPHEIFPFLALCDMVLVMSVEPGFGGQKFMPSALEKLRVLKQEISDRGLTCLLEVDGGINAQTAAQAADAGADVLVVGNYLFSSNEKKERVDLLKSL